MVRYVAVLVPLVSLIVARDPATVLCKNRCVVPTPVVKEPTVFVVPFFSLTVPLVIVKARVDPCVSASANWNVPPTPLKVRGQSTVLPLVVMVFVPEVAAKTSAPVVAVNVIPLDSVRLPYSVLATAGAVHAPEKPVKLRSRNPLP